MLPCLREGLAEATGHNTVITEFVENRPDFSLSNYVISMGCASQTIWNTAHRRDVDPILKKLTSL